MRFEAKGIELRFSWICLGRTRSTRAQALSAMRLMHNEKAVLPELTEQFEAAEAWLRPMRP